MRAHTHMHTEKYVSPLSLSTTLKADKNERDRELFSCYIGLYNISALLLTYLERKYDKFTVFPQIRILADNPF